MTEASSFSPNLSSELASLPVFHGVESGVIRDLAVSAHTAHYQRGALLVAQGDAVSKNYMVLEGWCGANKGNAEGQEVLLQLFRRGDFLFEPTQGVAHAVNTSLINFQALTSVLVVSFSATALRQAEKKSPTLVGNLLNMSARRCRDLRDHIEQLMLHSAEERLGRFLLRLRLGTTPSGRDVVLPFDKAAIAAYLGIKPETLSRVFQSFRKKGFVVNRSHLTLPSSQALCVYCDKSIESQCLFANMGDCQASSKGERNPK